MFEERQVRTSRFTGQARIVKKAVYKSWGDFVELLALVTFVQIVGLLLTLILPCFELAFDVRLTYSFRRI